MDNISLDYADRYVANVAIAFLKDQGKTNAADLFSKLIAEPDLPPALDYADRAVATAAIAILTQNGKRNAAELFQNLIKLSF